MNFDKFIHGDLKHMFSISPNFMAWHAISTTVDMVLSGKYMVENTVGVVTHVRISLVRDSVKN